MLKLSTILMCSVATLAAICSCGVNRERIEQPKNTNLQNSEVRLPDSVFNVSTLCSIPAKAAAGTPFAGLSGGSWTGDGIVKEEWDYSCSGDKHVNLIDNEVGRVMVNYGTIGGKNDVKYVSVEYTASYHGGLDNGEKKLRNDYVNFIESMSKQLYGQPLPPKVRTDLSGRKEFHKSDTGTAVGTGYINYLLNTPTQKAVDIDVKFFGSKAEYEKFKNE